MSEYACDWVDDVRVNSSTTLARFLRENYKDDSLFKKNKIIFYHYRCCIKQINRIITMVALNKTVKRLLVLCEIGRHTEVRLMLRPR